MATFGILRKSAGHRQPDFMDRIGNRPLAGFGPENGLLATRLESRLAAHKRKLNLVFKKRLLLYRANLEIR